MAATSAAFPPPTTMTSYIRGPSVGGPRKAGPPLADVLHQFRWVEHLEFRTHRTESQSWPVQVVYGHAEPAAPLVDLFDSCPPANRAAHRRGRSVYQRLDGMRRGDIAEAGPDKRR